MAPPVKVLVAAPTVAAFVASFSGFLKVTDRKVVE